MMQDLFISYLFMKWQNWLRKVYIKKGMYHDTGGSLTTNVESKGKRNGIILTLKIFIFNFEHPSHFF